MHQLCGRSIVEERRHQQEALERTDALEGAQYDALVARGDEVHVLRGEMLLDGGGRICLGRSRTEGASEVIVYKRDRRSMYRATAS